MVREPSKEEHLNAQAHESEDDDCSDHHPDDFSGFTRAHENLTLSIASETRAHAAYGLITVYLMVGCSYIYI